jgi:hypothetical protein
MSYWVDRGKEVFRQPRRTDEDAPEPSDTNKIEISETGETKQEPPFAPGLDECHANSINNADTAENRKAAEEWQAHRLWHRLNTGEDIGGWLQSGSCSGREIYRLRGRMIDWT